MSGATPAPLAECTLWPLVRRYVDGRLQRREIVARTHSRMRSVLGQLAISFGRRPASNLSQRDVEQWIESRGAVSLATLRQEVLTVRGFVRWMQRERVLKGDPMIYIRTPKLPRSVPRALMDTEVRALLAVLPDRRAHAIVMLMLGLGLRRAEVCSLQVGDWDRVSRTLRVVGKGGHVRLIPVPSRVQRALDDYVSYATKGPMIRRHDDCRWSGTRPLSISRLSEMMQTWMTDAGIKKAAWDGKACHSLRHTLASEVADFEPDLRVVQQILGHANLSSTQIYLRFVEMGKLRAAMEGAADAGADESIAPR